MIWVYVDIAYSTTVNFRTQTNVTTREQSTRVVFLFQVPGLPWVWSLIVGCWTTETAPHRWQNWTVPVSLLADSLTRRTLPVHGLFLKSIVALWSHLIRKCTKKWNMIDFSGNPLASKYLRHLIENRYFSRLRPKYGSRKVYIFFEIPGVVELFGYLFLKRLY